MTPLGRSGGPFHVTTQFYYCMWLQVIHVGVEVNPCPQNGSQKIYGVKFMASLTICRILLCIAPFTSRYDVAIDLSRRIGQEPGVEEDRQLSFRQLMQVYPGIMSIVVSQVKWNTTPIETICTFSWWCCRWGVTENHSVTSEAEQREAMMQTIEWPWRLCLISGKYTSIPVSKLLPMTRKQNHGHFRKHHRHQIGLGSRLISPILNYNQSWFH